MSLCKCDVFAKRNPAVGCVLQRLLFLADALLLHVTFTHMPIAFRSRGILLFRLGPAWNLKLLYLDFALPASGRLMNVTSAFLQGLTAAPPTSAVLCGYGSGSSQTFQNPLIKEYTLKSY